MGGKQQNPGLVNERDTVNRQELAVSEAAGATRMSHAESGVRSLGEA